MEVVDERSVLRPVPWACCARLAPGRIAPGGDSHESQHHGYGRDDPATLEDAAAPGIEIYWDRGTSTPPAPFEARSDPLSTKPPGLYGPATMRHLYLWMPWQLAPPFALDGTHAIQDVCAMAISANVTAVDTKI